MTVKETNSYNQEFPEMFPWGHLDSPKLCSIAFDIVNHINHDLKTPQRVFTPGLRKALNIIAEIAEI